MRKKSHTANHGAGTQQIISRDGFVLLRCPSPDTIPQPSRPSLWPLQCPCLFRAIQFSPTVSIRPAAKSPPSGRALGLLRLRHTSEGLISSPDGSLTFPTDRSTSAHKGTYGNNYIVRRQPASRWRIWVVVFIRIENKAQGTL